MRDLDIYQFWKMAVCELYSLGFITDDDLIRVHNRTYFESKKYLIGVDRNIYLMCIDIFRNSDLFYRLLKENADSIKSFLFPEDKKNFKRIWISFLLDCAENNCITHNELNLYKEKIVFDSSDWNEFERNAATEIINKIRLLMMQTNSKLIEIIDSPDFNALAFANDLTDFIKENV